MDLVKKPKKQNSNNGFASTLKSGLETTGNVIKYTTPVYYGIVKNPMMKLWKRELVDKPDHSFYDTFNLLKIAPKFVDNWVKKLLANYIMDNNLKYFANRMLLYKLGNKIRKELLGGLLYFLPSALSALSGARMTLSNKKINLNLPRNQKIENGKLYQYNSDGTKTLITPTLIRKEMFPHLFSKKTKTPTVTPTTTPRKPYFLSKYLYREGIGIDNIKNWLRKIGVKDDGIWGDETEAAYKRYMNNLLPVKALEASPLSFLPYVEKYDIKPKEFVSAVDKKYGQPTIRPTQPVVTLYDRSGTRDWITTKLGHNPYEYTGAQRRALRYWLNGDKEGLNYDKNLLGVFGNLSLYAKQGAKLVSKNPVERFRVNFRKVVQ